MCSVDQQVLLIRQNILSEGNYILVHIFYLVADKPQWRNGCLSSIRIGLCLCPPKPMLSGETNMHHDNVPSLSSHSQCWSWNFPFHTCCCPFNVRDPTLTLEGHRCVLCYWIGKAVYQDSSEQVQHSIWPGENLSASKFKMASTWQAHKE